MNTPMQITLSCAFCGRRETQEAPWMFTTWMVILDVADLAQRHVCSEECGISWLFRRLMRRQLERERVHAAIQRERAQEAIQ